MTAWFYIGGIETGDTSLQDDADLLWSPPEVADEDNAFIAIMAATNLINCATLGTNSWDKADMSFVSGYANINTNRDSTARRIRVRVVTVRLLRPGVRRPETGRATR